MSTAIYNVYKGRPDPVRLFGGMWFLLLAVIVLWGIRLKAEAATSLADVWPSLLSSSCLACFYTILGLLIMMRPPARAQATSWLPKGAAFVGTYLPWSITFFGRADAASLNILSFACVMTGIIMMLVTIRHLGRSFSLVPQAHSVVQSGPYRWIRHPLYVAEEIAILGAVLQFLSPATVAILVMHVVIQICRIRYEENLLRGTCPEYAAYEVGRWRVIPHVW